MEVVIEKGPWEQVESDWLIVPVHEGDSFSGRLKELDAAMDGRLRRMVEWGDFSGKVAELVSLRDVPGLRARRVLLTGIGRENEVDVPRMERALRAAFRLITDKKGMRAAVALPVVTPLSTERLTEIAVSASIVSSAGQALYRNEVSRFELVRLQIAAADEHDESSLQTGVKNGEILGRAINLTRELVNRGPHEIFPESFSKRAEQVAAATGLTCEVFDEPRLKAERMEAMLAVNAGSTRPARMVVLKHEGGDKNQPHIALVGKGVTFDSGGLSLKTSEHMVDMKCDMAGAATVLGAMQAIAQLGVKANVVGYMGLVENMPSGSAFKLGDVLTARNGVTIEVLNTDAEGRLVLADVLSYAVDHGAAKVVDLATLTGACVVALGENVTGAFSNNQDWCNALVNAARVSGEDLWQMPMFELYDELIKSEVADIKNTGGRWGGAISAAKFLERFVGGRPWVHLDIAGPSFASSSKPHRDGGATGCMVKTLVELATRG